MMNQLRQGASLPHSKQLSNLVAVRIQVRQLPPLDFAGPRGYRGLLFHRRQFSFAQIRASSIHLSTRADEQSVTLTIELASDETPTLIFFANY